MANRKTPWMPGIHMRRPSGSYRDQVRVALARYGWLVAMALCLLVGCVLIWHRGLYVDDYFNRLSTINVLTGRWRPLTSPTRMIGFPARLLSSAVTTTMVALVAQAELWLRLGVTLAAGANAVLLAWLVKRVWGARLPAVLAGWLFAMPLLAPDVLLWTTASSYVLAAMCTLLCLHALWTALERPRRALPWALLGIVAFVAALEAVEALALAVGLLPLLSLARAARRKPTEYGRQLGRALLLMLPLLAVGVVFYLLFYRGSWTVANRGGVDLAPAAVLARCGGFFLRLRWMTVGLWGRAVFGDALALGLQTLRASWAGAFAFALALAVLLATAGAWRRDPAEGRLPARTGWIVAGAGLLWFLLTLLFPSVLVAGQNVEYRLVYMPTAGLALTAGALAWLLVRWLGRPWLENVMLALGGAILLFSTVGILGFARGYAARSELDTRQVAAIVAAIPSADLPKNAILVPVRTDEYLFGHRDSLSGFFTGVLETPWSARGALCWAYGRADLTAITANRWTRLQVEYDPAAAPAKALLIQGTPAPVARTLLVTLEGGAVRVVSRLLVQQDDGSEQVVVFPLAEALSAKGVPEVQL